MGWGLAWKRLGCLSTERECKQMQLRVGGRDWFRKIMPMEQQSSQAPGVWAVGEKWGGGGRRWY